MKKYFLSLLLLVLVVPSVVFASWWNPFSWQIFSHFHNNVNITQTQADIQRKELIKEFYNNPTLENFKTICDKAKNIDGNTTSQVLDSNRQNLITVKQSLYYDEGMSDCRRLNQDKYFVGSYFIPLDKTSLISFANDDTDTQRKIKIMFNSQINNLIATSKIKFVIFFVPADNISFDTFKLNPSYYNYKLVELGVNSKGDE